MTDAEALAAIHRLAAAGRFFLVPHARQRAAQRGITATDIRHALETALSASWQPDRATWKVESADLDGEALTLAVVIEASVIVVTVF